MSRLATVTRRTFLIGSAAIAGGVAFGTYMYKRPGPNPLKEGLLQGEAALTPYVLITPEGVTLITPRADSGQGAYSVQAALIAEELDIELDQVRVDPGVPSAVYYNTALADEGVPFPSTDQGILAETARGLVDVAMKFIGLQITGGSTTVPDGFDKLRLAGAVARETLKAAASRETGIAVSQMSTARGAVILPDGTELPYQSLAATAATLDPAPVASLRDDSEWRLIGKPMRRLDIVAKSTGTQKYGIDRAIDGMVFATLRLNPRQGGGIIGYDAAAAQSMRGVREILPVTGGVAVVADNTWYAMQAANALEIEWGPAPYPAEMEGHWQALSNAFVPEMVDSRRDVSGDVEAVPAGAETVEAEYRAPYLAHAPLEPVSAIVLITDERADVWTGTQIPRFVQNNVAEIAGLRTDQVFVHVEMMGGSFGHRLEDDYVKRTAEIAVQMKGVPVKLTYSREEDFAHDFPRQIAMARLRGSVRDGQVESFDLGIAMPSVVVSQMSRQGLAIPGPDSQIVAGAVGQPFSIPNYRVTGYRAEPLAPISSWRSVGASSNGFFHDCALDELIHAAGADPMAERIRLCWHEPSRKVLEAVRDMSGWDGPSMGENRGRGVAFCMSFGVPVAEVVEVTYTPAGIRIDKVYVAADVGRVVDPVNFDNLVKGGVIWGLGHAMNCEITYADGMAQQSNFHAFEGMRLYQCPEIEVRGLENGPKIRGIGEPPVPPAMAALGNAIFAATGRRIREMPFNKHIDFV